MQSGSMAAAVDKMWNWGESSIVGASATQHLLYTPNIATDAKQLSSQKLDVYETSKATSTYPTPHRHIFLLSEYHSSGYFPPSPSAAPPLAGFDFPSLPSLSRFSFMLCWWWEMSSWHNKQVVIREKRSVREVEVEIRDGNAWAHMSMHLWAHSLNQHGSAHYFHAESSICISLRFFSGKYHRTPAILHPPKLGYRKRRAEGRPRKLTYFASTATHVAQMKNWKEEVPARPDQWTHHSILFNIAFR